MASLPAYLALKWIHVLAAGVLVGGLTLMSLFRGRAEDAKGRRARGIVWSFLVPANSIMQWALVALLLTGLLMIYGPAAALGWDLLAHRWTLSGLILMIVMGALLGSLVAGTGKRLARAYESEKEPTEDLLKAERRWRAGVLATLAIAILTVALMVFKPAA